MELVSIIIPSYNYGWLLSETLESILAQTYSAWECIIVDDGSTDDTRKVAEVFQNRDSRFFYDFQSNSGMSAARNRGMRIAKGKYLQFLDADDLIAPTKLAVQVAFLQANPRVDILYGDVRCFVHQKPEILSTSKDFDNLNQQWMTPLNGSGDSVVKHLLVQNQLVMNAPLIRASFVEKVGYFDEALRSVEDWEYWIRCGLRGAEFAYLDTPETWALVRVHPTSVSQNFDRMLRFELQMREQLSREFEKVTQPTRGLWELLNAEEVKKLHEKLLITSFENKKWLVSIKDYLNFASTNGAYLQYLRAIIYWARH